MGKNNKSYNSKNTQGFTLIELLVVIVILSALSVAGISTFAASQKKSRDTRRKSDLAQIAKALEYYANDSGSYPSSSNGNILACGGTCTWGSAFTSSLGTVYMQVLPKDPSTFSYRYDKVGTGYTLSAYLESDFDPDRNTNLTTSCGSKNCTYVLRSSNLTPTPKL